MKKILFQEKVEYLFFMLKKSENDFLKLFLKDGQKLSSRKKTVIDNWLKGEMKDAPKAFHFDEYRISTFKCDNDEMAFTKDSFMNNSLESFKIEVDNYITYKNKPKELFEYKYIYYFDVNQNQINFFELNTIEKIHNNAYKVKLIPSDFFKDRGVEVYVGILKIDRDYYHISVENYFETLTFYFMRGRGVKNNSKVHGIGLGLSYDEELPLSTKDLLTKEPLTEDEKKDFYLSANESEYLLSDELLENIYSTTKENYINKFHKKLNNLATFTTKSREILKDTIENDVYLNLFHKSFISVNEISKKVIQNQYFFIYRRRTAMKIFLKSIAAREDSFCNMIYPVFKSDSILFDKSDERSKELLNLSANLSGEGLKIQIIFIVSYDFKVTKYFKKAITHLIDSGLSIKIAFIEDVDKLKVSSYDFIYSKEKDVAIYTSMRDRIRIFKVTKAEERIKTLFYDFKKIESVSSEFYNFLSNPHNQNNKVLNSLIGKWHWYFYGSMEDNSIVKVWDILVNIQTNGEVECINKNDKVLLLSGTLDSTYNQNQSFIITTANESRNLSIVLLDNREIHKQVFRVTMIDKQHGRQGNMATFGIFSRSELEKKDIRYALGNNVDETRLLENQKLEIRVNELDMKVKSLSK
ncbi:hypothetical protein KKC13_04605 [bacterium]|nr:hypothetical protein [bacterium]MBU1958328.1 hypothetical protein [bacterium]